MSEARTEILRRVRSALTPADGSTPPPAPVPARDYRLSLELAPEALRDLLIDRLLDYRAEVVRCADTPVAIADTVGETLRGRSLSPVVAPPLVAQEWLADLAAGADVTVLVDDPALGTADLDAVSAVVTGSALAIAETGVVVLDGGPRCGRRAISLVPDVHVCVVRMEQVVALPPQAVARLDPTRPQTWIAGPSATSDIELSRVEGVHGPRTLVVVLAG